MNLQEVGCGGMDWIGLKSDIAERLAIFEIIKIEYKKNWKKRRKDRAASQRSFNDEVVRNELCWHVRRRRSTRICNAVQLICRNSSPSSIHF